MFKTILVPVDWTTLSEPAVTAAIEFSTLHNSKIIGLSVAPPRLFNSTRIDAQADGAIVEAANRALARESVAKVAALAAMDSVPCETVISQSPIPSDDIVDVAKRYHCDVVFMVTRGRMGVIDTAFNESQTQRVLRKISIPVLVFTAR